MERGKKGLRAVAWQSPRPFGNDLWGEDLYPLQPGVVLRVKGDHSLDPSPGESVGSTGCPLGSVADHLGSEVPKILGAIDRHAAAESENRTAGRSQNQLSAAYLDPLWKDTSPRPSKTTECLESCDGYRLCREGREDRITIAGIRRKKGPGRGLFHLCATQWLRTPLPRGERPLHVGHFRAAGTMPIIATSRRRPRRRRCSPHFYHG
jgi:hypothetical protein